MVPFITYSHLLPNCGWKPIKKSYHIHKLSHSINKCNSQGSFCHESYLYFRCKTHKKSYVKFLWLFKQVNRPSKLCSLLDLWWVIIPCAHSPISSKLFNVVPLPPPPNLPTMVQAHPHACHLVVSICRVCND